MEVAVGWALTCIFHIDSQSNMLAGSSRYPLNTWSHVAPTAPSITLWSHDSVTVTNVPSSNDPGSSLLGTTFFSAAPTARIHACGGFTMAANWDTPNMPKLEMVNVPSAESAGSSLPSLALAANSLTLEEMAARPFFSALRTTGTMRPAAV